jgi:hypothetical protein
MAGVNLRRRSAKGCSTPPDHVTEPVPALPAWKAFVVQFSRETGAQPGVFSGRVEHLSSGRRAHFSSAEELTSILTCLLAELGEVAK